MSTTSCDCLNCSSGNGQPCLVADVPMGRAGSGDTFVLTGAGNPNYMPPPPEQHGYGSSGVVITMPGELFDFVTPLPAKFDWISTISDEHLRGVLREAALRGGPFFSDQAIADLYQPA